MNANLAMLWMIALPLLASPLIYVAGRVPVRNGKSPRLARWLVVLVLAATFIPLAISGSALLGGSKVEYAIGKVTLRMDGLSLLLAGTVLVLGLLVAFYSTRYIAGEAGEEKFYALLSAMVGTMVGLGCSADLFNLWVWFEAMTISSFMLVTFYQQQPTALEAGIKYLVMSAIGSVFVLLGISLVFAQTGTLDLMQIRNSNLLTPGLIIASGTFFVIGFGVKAAFVPLHTWLPDAHSQAPSGISAMLSGVVIEAGLIAMLRALAAVVVIKPELWGTLLLVFGAVNMLIGNLMALRQTQVKRLLAFSSVAHMGYMLLGLGVAIGFQSLDGAQGAFFHLINHALMKGLAFLAAGALLYALYISRGKHDPLEISDLDGISRRYPLAAFSFSIAVLGLGGLPPLAGFMSKWQIFVAGFNTHIAWVMALVIFAALNSVLSLAYYAPLVNRIYRHEPAEVVAQGEKISWVMTVPLVILTLAVVVLGFYPVLMNWLTLPAAKALLAAFGG